ncbi:MAG: hypothetical protein HYT08_00325 [Candidatus Levybacteria bacterium]|nr:hypothetical protein [Candidatus Levybacteria bacterium]
MTLKIKNTKLNGITTAIIVLGVIFAGVLFNNFFVNKTVPQQRVLADFQPISPHYFDYSEGTLTQAYGNGNTVLFFAATAWCNTCSALDKELREKSASLPENLTVLKIDYDHDSFNKKKYGIAQQHTMVYLDSQGNEIKRWIGGDFDTLVAQIN